MRRLAFIFLLAVVAPATARADDASTIISAEQLDSQLSASFDRTGKFPGGIRPSFHATVLKALTFIPKDSPRYGDAQRLIEKYKERQTRIDKLTPASLEQRSDIKIELKQVDMSYSSFRGSFVLENPNPFPVADIRILCSVFAGSGTVIKEYNETIFEIVPAKGKKKITGHRFGYWPEQGKKVGCHTTGFQRR